MPWWSALLCSSWSSPGDWLGMTDRYEESQLWLQEPRLLLTDRDDRISSSHHPSNSIIMQHSCLGHCSGEDTRAGVLSSDAGDHWCCPRGLATSDRVLGVGARPVWCIRVLASPGPSHPSTGGPARAQNSSSSADQLSVTRHKASSEDREDRPITQVSSETQGHSWRNTSLLSAFLYFTNMPIFTFSWQTSASIDERSFSEYSSYWVLNKVNIQIFFWTYKSFLGRCKESSEKKSEFKWGLQLEKKSSEKINLRLAL